MRLSISDWLILTLFLSCGWLLVKYSLATGGRFTLTSSLELILCEYPDKLSSPETRMIVLPDAEDGTIVSSFVWTKHGNVTDGRKDSQTDGQTARGYYSLRSALCAMRTRCKNYWLSKDRWTTVFRNQQNFEPRRGICCSAADVSRALEFRFFFRGNCPIYSSKQMYPFGCLIPATCLKSA